MMCFGLVECTLEKYRTLIKNKDGDWIEICLKQEKSKDKRTRYQVVENETPRGLSNFNLVGKFECASTNPPRTFTEREMEILKKRGSKTTSAYRSGIQIFRNERNVTFMQTVKLPLSKNEHSNLYWIHLDFRNSTKSENIFAILMYFCI